VDAYEELRRQEVESERRADYRPGRGILLRRGLAAWAQIRTSIAPAVSRESPLHPAAVHQSAASPVFGSLGAELVRLVAGLILTTRQERFLHA